MKRLIPIFILILLWAGSAWGADYYVNNSTGSNANNGTAIGTPWKDVAYADDMVSAGDTINIISSATNPLRNIIFTTGAGADGSEITIQGTSASSLAYILGSIDISHGAYVGNVLISNNPDFEGWIAADDPWAIVSAGDTPPGREPTTGNGTPSLNKTGEYCAKFTDDGANPELKFYTYLPQLSSVSLIWQEYVTNGTRSLKVRIQANNSADGDDYLQANGTWGSVAAAIEYGDVQNSVSANTWSGVSVPFTTDDHGGGVGKYTIIMFDDFGNADNTYLDDINIILNTGTGASAYAWSAYGGGNVDTYVLKNALPTAVETLLKCTDAEWSSQGCEALKLCYDGAEISLTDNTNLNQGEWYYDSANNDLYYRLASDETDITDIHFETGDNKVRRIEDSEKGAVAYLGHDYVDLNYLWIGGGNDNGISMAGTKNDVTYCTSVGNERLGFGISGTTGLGIGNTAKYNEDNYECVAGGEGTYIRCISENPTDDGFQANSGSTMTVLYSLSTGAGMSPHGEEKNDNAGFSVEGAGAGITIYNCTAYGNYGRGLQIGASTVAIIKNTISYGNTGTDADESATAISNTHTHNIFGDKSAAWTTHTTEKAGTDPNFKNTTDFRLKCSSPARKTGDVSIVGSTDTDINGNAMIEAGLVNMGAYTGCVGGGGQILNIGGKQGIISEQLLEIGGK